jgi:hypothetical protein
MLETHIVMSSLIFRLVLSLVLRLAFLLVLCLVSIMDLIIAHMILVHERITLCLNALVMVHIRIMVIISRVGLFFCWSVSLTLSPNTWMVHVFSIVVYIPLGQMVTYKGL